MNIWFVKTVISLLAQEGYLKPEECERILKKFRGVSR